MMYMIKEWTWQHWLAFGVVVFVTWFFLDISGGRRKNREQRESSTREA